jgi:hypothetical protein
MQKQETLIVLGINTIIVVIVLFILFKMQDNKVRTYIKKLERKLLRPQMIPEYDPNIMMQQQLQLQQQQTQQLQQMQIQPNTDNNIKSDMDSYIDPMNE